VTLVGDVIEIETALCTGTPITTRGVGGWLLMALFMLLFWGGLIAAIFAFVRLATDQSPSSQPPNDARRLLEERCARSEIDTEEYTRRRDLLARK
jgi:putative membrane protein